MERAGAKTEERRGGWSRAVTVMCAAVFATAAGGCNIVGPLGYFAHGPEKIKAQYTLEPDRSHVVFVDDRDNVLRDRSLRRVIAQSVEARLLESDAVQDSEIISSRAVEEATAGDRWGKPTGIAQVGAIVGADVVIYATIDSFSLSQDRTSLSPRAQVRVKVVDSQTKQRLWPGEGQEWQPVTTAVPRRDGTLPASLSELAVEEKTLAERVGRDIAHLFLDHEANPSENRIGD